MSQEDGTGNGTSYKTIVYFICGTAALGGLLFGLDQGFIANSLDTILSSYKLDIKGGENYSAILATGGVIGALLSGLFARFLGRKKSLVFAGFIFTAASLISALLPPLPILSACRFCLGFAVGVASFIVPLYLSETAPAKIRGSMGTLFQLLITIGIFLISVTNVAIARTITNPSSALSLMFLTITFFALLMFIGSFILPESPRYLMLKGRREQAVAVLQKTLNTQGEVDFEIGEIEKTLGEPGANVGIIFKGYFFKVLLVGVLLQMFQQLVGINVMIYYAPTIFGYAGMTGLIAKMTIPTVNMLFTFPAIRLVEKWGRKKLLYMGGACMLLTMLAAGVAFTMVGTPSAPSPDAVRKLDSDVNGFITKAEFQAFAKERGISDDEKLADLFQKIDSDRDGSITRPELKGAFDVNWQKANKIQGQMKAFLFGLGDIGAAPKWILLISAVIYIFGFAISWGPVVWLVCSEIFPLEGREVGMTITTMVNWTFAGLLMANALTFMDTYGNASIFYVFAVFCIGSIIFTRLFVPETKGITLEELEYNLKRGKPMRNLGDPVHIE